MKISLNTIRGLNKRYGCTHDIAPNGIDELVEKIGAQLGAVEEVTAIGKKYQGAVIVKIIKCEKHTGSDHLNVCTIDDGSITPSVNRDEDGYVQVVCGAPNVRSGLSVVWLPPGSTVPESYDKEPFVLDAREIRGVVSSGMLASARELGIGDDHEGILELDDDAEPGTLFADKYDLNDDYIIDIENKMFTHRPDCFGFLGVSRELAGIQNMPFKSPDWYSTNPEFPGLETDELPLEVQNDIPELVPRFTAIAMAHIEIMPSPVWLQVELSKVGLRPINNIVDYTNFFMLETGQPLHAYDYDKVAKLSSNGSKLIVRKPHAGEKIMLLNGKEITPNPNAIMIATDQKSIGIGGVMGGGETEVDAQTKNIILECANFDMYSIRRTAMEHGIFTDAVTRFNKGQSPLQNLAVLGKIVDEIRKFAGGKVASTLLDDNHLTKEVLDRNSLHPPVNVSTEFINARLGLQLGADEISALLTNVEFKVSPHDASLDITAPFWRTDIEIPEDIIEEVGRLYGYDHLPLELPSRDLTPASKNNALQLKQHIRETLAKAGANELLTYSFVHGNLLDQVGQDRAKAYKLSNALSPDLQYYRMSLTPSLLDKVHANIKAGYDELAIFELGKAHIKGLEEDGLPTELERLALVFAADKKTAQKYPGAPYYLAQNYLAYLLKELGLKQPVSFVHLDATQQTSESAYYQPGRSAAVRCGDILIGHIGEYKQPVRRSLKLPDICAGFELDLSLLMENLTTASRYTALSRFPGISQDMSLKVPVDLPYSELQNFIDQNLEAPTNSQHSFEPKDIYQRQEDTEHKQVTLRLHIVSYLKTMTAGEVDKLLNDVSAKAHAQFGAERL